MGGCGTEFQRGKISTYGEILIVDDDHDASYSSRDEGTQARVHNQHCVAVDFLVKDVDDSAGTVTGPLSVHYYSGKAAVIRATGCVQAELDIQGFNDIHLYALHPGACRTGIQSTHSLPFSVYFNLTYNRTVGSRCRGRFSQRRSDL